MGGRGGGSGNPDNPNPYYAIIDKIAKTEGNPTRRAAAQTILDTQGGTTTTSVKNHDMSEAEDMYSITIGGVTLHYATKDNRTLDTIAAIEDVFGAQLDTVDGWTTDIFLATHPAATIPTNQGSAGTGDGSVVLYSGCHEYKMTVAHEVAHNFVKKVLVGYSGLGGSPYQDAVEEELPAAYPAANGNLEEDFVESSALLLLDPDGFKKHWPRRAALIKSISTWLPE